MPPRVPAHVALYALALVPPSCMAWYYTTYGPSDEELEEKLRERYGKEIRASEGKRNEMSKIFQAAIRKPGTDETINSQLDEMLRAGKDARSRLHAVNEDLYGTEHGVEVRQRMEEQRQQEEEEKKKKKKQRRQKKMKKKEKKLDEMEKEEHSNGTITDEEETKEGRRNEEEISVVDAVFQEGAGTESKTATTSANENSDSIPVKTKKLKKKKNLKKKSHKGTGSVDEVNISLQTVVTVASIATVAALVGFLAGSNRRT